MSADNLATIVDEYDQVIGSTPRHDVAYANIYRVAALWLTNSKDEVLLAQRAFTKRNNPGLWGPAVAGTVEPGETYEENIYREAEEEIGMKNVEFTQGPKFLVDEKLRRYYMQWFMATLDFRLEKFKLQTDEVADVAWVSTKQVFQELHDRPEKYVPSATKWVALVL